MLSDKPATGKNAHSTSKWRRDEALVHKLCVAATFALERIGYRLTTAAFLVFFLGAIERKHPLTVVMVSAGFSLASFYVISVLLRVPLPRGPWGF